MPCLGLLLKTLLLIVWYSTAMNITRGHVRCLSEDHLAAAAAATEPKRCTEDAVKHQHQKQLHPLKPQTSSRRYSCPPRSVLSPFTDDDDTQTETRFTMTSGERYQRREDSQEMTVMLSAVENLLHNLLVRYGCYLGIFTSCLYCIIAFHFHRFNVYVENFPSYVPLHLYVWFASVKSK